MTNEERLDRLERLYEQVYHDYELLAIYIPRLTDIMIRYWSTSNKHRTGVKDDLLALKGELINTRTKIVEHISFSRKKRNFKY